MTRDDLFKVNAGIVQSLIKGIAETSPKAFVLIISNPVNSTVPIAAEVLKGANVFDPKRLFGVTTLDVVRAETFAQEFSGQKVPSQTTIPVVGGHSGDTIVPLFSMAKPAFQIPADKYDALVHRKWDDPNRAQTVADTILQASNSVVMRSSRPRAALAPPLCRWPTPASGQFRHGLRSSPITDTLADLPRA